MNEENLTELSGLPVRDYVPGGGLPDAGAVAWRLRCHPEGPTFREQLGPFLAEPATVRVRALVIGTWSEAPDRDDSEPVISALASNAAHLPDLRALFLGDICSAECDLASIRQGDVLALAAAFPALEAYGARGRLDQTKPRSLSSPRLRTLSLESGGMPASVVRALGGSELPSLDHLELWLGTDELGGDATASDLRSLLAGNGFPALRRLGLRNSIIADDVAAALADAPITSQVEVLDLSLGALGDEGALSLLRGRPLSHLTLLDLHHHFLTDEGMAHVRASGLHVDLSDRQVEDSGGRYVAFGA